MGQMAPRNVTTEELHRLLALVEDHGAPLVGALLAAYGSCREPRDEPPEQPLDGDTTDETVPTEVDEPTMAAEE
jgi:hypothetical protein